ncbi:MAG TPA: SPFH domain-containing protein, partial [Gemmataceae bacterium]|nr:SPFH domain-containing protein [Gemmataceae bacterium]
MAPEAAASTVARDLPPTTDGPQAAAAPHPPNLVPPATNASKGTGGFPQPPSTFGQMSLYLLVVWAAVGILAVVVSLFSIYTKILAAVVFLAATVAVGEQVWKLMRARQRVLTEKDVPILWGFVRLIAWDPIEGILILSNKSVGFSDDNLADGRGGVRFLYPILGEELALRVPLEVQTLRFADENVLTREYLSVTIRGTMKWRIVNIEKFYLLVSRELRSTTDRNDRVTLSPSTRPAESGDSPSEPTIVRLLNAAIEWMRVLAEEQTRFVVSRARSGLLIADQLSQELVTPGHSPGGAQADTQSAGAWGGAADGLASAIHETIARRLEGFGIAVEDVSLQEIKLPDEVVRECVVACKSFYYPVRARREAAFDGAKLQAQVDAIGKEAVATREVVGAAPAFGVADFISAYLNKRLSAQNTEGGAGGAPSLEVAAMAAL